MRQKLVHKDDQNENLKRQMATCTELYDKQTINGAQKDEEIEQLKFGIEEMQKALKSLNTEKKRLEAAN